MDVSDILAPLNEAQREAVTAPERPTLVLAGAGSGKTRVLVHRIAWLVRATGVSPYGILAVTFTNKAAGEMRGRTLELLDVPAGGMWVGTFHGLAHRLLRVHWRDAGLAEDFQIMDSEDQYRLIRRTVRELELDEALYPPRQIQWAINAHKDEGRRPQHIDHHDDPYQKTLVRIYQGYEKTRHRAGQVDFAELLLRVLELWRQRPDILAGYQERFRHVLVDEFQDINAVQYAWLRILAGDAGRLFAVGDDDQSIYGWRGARVENLLNFQKDFRAAQLIRLEQNYRSTGTILKAANALIAHNEGRLGKELWTDAGAGEPIRLYAAFNETDEARFVVEQVRQWAAGGDRYGDCAVLYRANAQSRQFEEALLAAGIPYRVYGGLRFFERAEIKDALAYLRLLANRDDDPSFERVVNTPPRGIGTRTVGLIRDHARAQDRSMWRAAEDLCRTLPARAARAVEGFRKLMTSMDQATQGAALAEQVQRVISASELMRAYEKEGAEQAQNRRENLDELVSAALEFGREAGDAQTDIRHAFLAHAALEAGAASGGAEQDAVQLMTLHSAKGLEFEQVFLGGLEEGLFPHQRSAEQADRLEEERRLCYVGMTRARRQLYLSFAESRRLHGEERYSQPSRFIWELPRELIEELRPQVRVRRPLYLRSAAVPSHGLRLGQRVQHAKFGEGVVLSCEGEGESARVQVNFETAGRKWLVVAFAKLTSL